MHVAQIVPEFRIRDYGRAALEPGHLNAILEQQASCRAAIAAVQRLRDELLALAPITTEFPGACCPHGLADDLVGWVRDFEATLANLGGRA